MNTFALMVLVIFVVSGASTQQSAIDSLRMDWEQFELRNGLRVVLQPDSNQEEVSVEFWVRAGVRDEEWGNFGLAHFAEHATPYGLAADTSARTRLRSMMSNSNAQTRKDYTRYFIQVEPEAMELALQYVAERLSTDTSQITEEIVERHRKNVLAEIERNSSNAFWGFLSAGVRDAGTFGSMQPYGHSAYGTPEENERFTVHDIQDWYNRFISPRNTVLFVVGRFDNEKTRALITQHFERLPGGNASPAVSRQALRQSTERVTIHTPSKYHTLSLTWALPAHSETDDAALRLAAYILDDRLADSTRIPASVVEAGSSYLMNRYELAGQFGMYAEFFTVSDSTFIEQKLARALEDIAESGVSDHELRRARSVEIDRIKEMMESLGFIGSRTELLGEGLLFAGDPDHYLKLLKQQSSLEQNVVQAAVRQWLNKKPFRLLAVSTK